MAESGIAVDLGGTKVAFGIVSARGVVRKRIVEPVDREAAVDQIVRLVWDLDGEARAQPLAAAKVEIKVSTLQTDANLSGAARLELDRSEE